MERVPEGGSDSVGERAVWHRDDVLGVGLMAPANGKVKAGNEDERVEATA